MGKLWLITTPIGNSLDITLRAKSKIEELETIITEDTRSFRKLCSLHEIETEGKKIYSYHDQSTPAEVARIIKSLESEDIGYLSEAGSPIISDPAYPLVRACVEAGIEVESCSGVSSVIMGLELSGLPAHPFTFHGFPPRNKQGQVDLLNECQQVGGTHIFFEGVSRVLKTVDHIAQFSPKAKIVLIREMSKLYQSIHRFTAAEWNDHRSQVVEKGEFVILISMEKKPIQSEAVTKILVDIEKKGAKPKLMAKLLAELTEQDSSECYAKYFKNNS